MGFLKNSARLVLSAAVMAAMGVSAQAAEQVGVVSHLNLVSDKSEDVSSLEALQKTYIKEGMSDQDKAIAIFNALVKYRHQASPPDEFLSSSAHVHDPIKSIHVYGYGQCCCASAEVMNIARSIGMKARGRNINAHSVPEVFYDDSWHLVDCSVMNYHVKDDGKLASVDEIHQAVRGWFKENPELFEKMAGKDSELRKFAKNEGWKKGPPLLAKAENFYGKDGINSAGWHGWPSTMQEYYKVEEKPFEFGGVIGHQLNVQLRPGEKITRNFFSRGIEYTNKMSKDYYKSLQDRKVLGIQSKLGDKAPGRVGDGSIEWNVPMQLDALKAVALSTEGLAAAGNGVGAADPSKPGSFVLRFPNSYVYVKGALKLNANVAEAGSVVISYSDNNGLDWKEVTKIDKAGEQTIDLNKLVARRYDYRLKFDLNGTGTSLSNLVSTLDFQLSQAALPVITEGENTLTFKAGPQEGTVTIEGATDAKAAEKGGQVKIADFKPELNGVGENLRMTEGKGDATFKITTPGDMTRVRVSMVWRARDAKKDGWETQVSFDGGKTFKPVENGVLQGGTTGEGRYLVVKDIPTGTTEALVKFVGKQGNTTTLFDLRIDADYAEPSGGFKPVKITYNWEEAGQKKSDTHIAKRETDSWKITCGAKAVVKSFTMELAE